MKDIVLLIRQRKEFYLTVLVITLLLTIVGAFYNISVEGKKIAELNVDLVTEDRLETMVTEQGTMFAEGLSSQGLMKGFFNNFTYMGYFGLNLVIAVVVLLSYSDKSEKGAKEFLETLPVKRVALELYNYVALMGILLLNLLVSLVIHLVQFSKYNGKIITLAERFPNVLGSLVPDNLVAAHNVSLLYQFGMLALYLVVMVTLIMVCMAVFKNGVAGFFVGAILWNTANDVLYTVRFLFTDISDKITDSFRQVVAVFKPQLYFDRFEWNNGVCTNDFTGYVAVSLLVMLLVLLAVYIIHAHCRELSGGKILYVRTLNIVMLIVFGFWLLITLIGVIGYSASRILTATCIVVIAEIIVIRFLYYKKDKIYKLSVKENRKVSNPVLRQGLWSFLIAAGIIALITEIIDWDYNLAMLKYDMIHIYTVWFPEEPLHFNLFDSYYRYQFATPILVGFIVFKCIQFAMENTKARREFYETLPMSRLRMFCTKLLMDLGVILIPLAVYVTVSIGYLMTANRTFRTLYPELEITAMVGGPFVAVLMVLCVAIALLGAMYLIDAVTVGGRMKDLFCGVTALFIFILAILVMDNANYTFLDEVMVVFWGSVTMVSAMVWLVLGIVMLVAAGYLYVRRDAAKEIFYYKAAKYVFASMLSISYLIFVMSGAYEEQALYQYILAVIGAVLIFFLTIYYCTPGKIAELQKKFQKKKTAK